MRPAPLARPSRQVRCRTLHPYWPFPPPPSPDLCPALPRELRSFAARVALCRVGGGALQVGWSCLAAQVELCRVSDRILTGLGPMGAPQEAKLNPRGNGPSPARQSCTHAAKPLAATPLA